MNLVRFAADFAAFWRAFYETYDITTEIAVLLFVMATLMIVSFSRPENNYMYKHFLAGIHLSMVLIILISSGQVALYTIAAGVSLLYPPFTSLSHSSSSIEVLR